MASVAHSGFEHETQRPTSAARLSVFISSSVENLFGHLRPRGAPPSSSPPLAAALVGLLTPRERTTGEWDDDFDPVAPAISRQRNVLRDVGLIATRAECQARIRPLRFAGLDGLDAWLEWIRSTGRAGSTPSGGSWAPIERVRDQLRSGWFARRGKCYGPKIAHSALATAP